MYQSKRKIQSKGLGILKSELAIFLAQQDFVYSKGLRKRVLLSKLPEAILNRKSTQKARLECFLVAMDILRNSTDYSIRVNGKNQKEVEMYGMSVDNKQVKIHLREEITSQKDKRTYFVSCFYKI